MKYFAKLKIKVNEWKNVSLVIKFWKSSYKVRQSVNKRQ